MFPRLWLAIDTDQPMDGARKEEVKFAFNSFGSFSIRRRLGRYFQQPRIVGTVVYKPVPNFVV